VKSLISFQNVTFRYPETDADVLEGLSLELPNGIVSLIGQNGTGKTTLLLLAAGSLLPASGRVFLRGIDTAELRDEAERHRHVSFIYQNMEFETKEPISALLRFVYESGCHARRSRKLIPELVEVFELSSFLDRRTQEVSKGELQRTILAFSLLYGSPVLVMDEPIFALEDYQKKRAMEYLTSYARKNDVSLYYSVHELDISREYSDYILLFSRGAPPRVGPTSELFTRDTIEQAYGVPLFMLKKREQLYRDFLIEVMRKRDKPGSVENAGNSRDAGSHAAADEPPQN
jgi:ABC-type cobalamin/Fe3+-siderophores transport system ATPase subunit